MHLVLLQGQGGVTVPLDSEWQATGLKLYDKGERPAIEMKSKQPGVELSILLFKNLSTAPTSEGCRNDVIGPLLKRFSGNIEKKTIHQSELTSDAGQHLVTEEYLLPMNSSEIAAATDIHLEQGNTFAFYGDKNICAELHISQVFSKDTTRKTFESDIKAFKADGAYVASTVDYAQMGSIYYNVMKDYPSAGSYYQRALDTLPPQQQPQQLTLFRYLNDQASMSYGISGDLKRSREINQAAIAKDPDYPLYYYNLACADAESGKATDAQTHLKQAFDRRANTLPGEKLPDPAQDDSILKLKKNKEFWDFVQTLPKN